MDDLEKLLRTAAASPAVRFGTIAPFQLGNVEIEKIGFADIPVMLVNVYCRREDITALVPIVRQHVFGELETAGFSNEIVEFTPGVATNQVRMFVDCNESSPSLGKRRRGNHCRFTFEIKKEHVGKFDWGGFCGKYGSIPVALKG